MKIPRALKFSGPLVAILALAVLTTAYALTLSPTQAPQAQANSFSIAKGDPFSLATGVHPADILGIGGSPLNACQTLGLLCTDAGSQDDIQALSYGWDFTPYDLPPMQFSVGRGSDGLPGTAVRVEKKCTPPEPHTDVFQTHLDQSNVQDLDGDGVPCSTNSGFGLILNEGLSSDNVDALERDPCQFVDLNCDGYPENPILFSLEPSSPSLIQFGASAADILIVGAGGYGPLIWASAADLGLKAGDAIDALCVWENGNGVYDPKDRVLFSLAPGSPTLGTTGSAADLLRPKSKMGYAAMALGLRTSDNVDAAVCTFDYTFFDVFLPMTFKN